MVITFRLGNLVMKAGDDSPSPHLGAEGIGLKVMAAAGRIRRLPAARLSEGLTARGWDGIHLVRLAASSGP